MNDCRPNTFWIFYGGKKIGLFTAEIAIYDSAYCFQPCENYAQIWTLRAPPKTVKPSAGGDF